MHRGLLTRLFVHVYPVEMLKHGDFFFCSERETHPSQNARIQCTQPSVSGVPEIVRLKRQKKKRKVVLYLQGHG